MQEEQQPYYQYPGPAQPEKRQRGGCGCWIVGLLTSFIVTILIVVGLFLPPISLGDRLFGPQYVQLSAQSNAVAIDAGLTLIVDPADPGEQFGVALNATDINTFLSTNDDAAIRAAVPPYLALQSPVYSVDTTGTAPQSTTLTIDLPANAAPPDLLDLYGWDADQGEWAFIPSRMTADNIVRADVTSIPERFALFQATPLAPIVLTKIDVGQQVNSAITGIADIVSPAGMQPALPTSVNQTLVGNPAGGFETSADYAVMPYIRNFADPLATDPDTVTAIISNRTLRDTHVEELTAFAAAGNYDGLLIDYRDLPADQRDNFSGFVQALASRFADANLQLGVVVPAAQNVEGVWQTGAYDWRSIGQHADFVQVNFSLNPTAFTPGPDRLIEAMLRWAVGEVSRYKLLGGLSALSVQETLPTGDFRAISYSNALSALGDVRLDVEEGTTNNIVQPGSTLRLSLDGFDAVPGVDTDIQAPYVNYYADDGVTVTSRMWLTTGEALRFRMDRMTPFALGGVAFPDLLAPGIAAGVPEAILNYKIQLPSADTPEELVLNWRIESTEGRITEFTTGFRDEIVVTLDAPDGNYAVNVDVVGGEIASSRGGAAIALFAPTATPTPMPTSTPSPTPTATPTLVPIVPTPVPPSDPAAVVQPAPPPSGGLPTGRASNPGAGSISMAGFEYGGHVTSTNSTRAVDAMRRAGMTWMKVQLRWGRGGGTDQAAAYIREAKGNGFKILLGIVGNPAELAAGGGDYIREYAAFTGAVAALGPDAIEVWNEPNLAREWPEGQISGANYTAMLRASYEAIKATNPGVMVISGAPAPTGAENAFPGQVVNDDNYLRQMVEAGALNFMDCLGMHYNEGLVGPRQTSGDPRDNYYTRYLPTLLDVYWSISGGAHPICITELGYLSPEGYPPLPSFFAWAQNVTVAQQAAWLADAAAYSSNSGRVRLMIVWNVDFEFYGADPMAGFAMIRPGGSCPACDVFAGAR